MEAASKDQYLSQHRDLLLPGARGFGFEILQEDGALWLEKNGSKTLAVAKDEAGSPWEEIRPTVLRRFLAAQGAKL